MPRRGDLIACRDCGTVALKPYPQAVTRGEWIYIEDKPVPYSLCGGCMLAQTRRILGGRSA